MRPFQLIFVFFLFLLQVGPSNSLCPMRCNCTWGRSSSTGKHQLLSDSVVRKDHFQFLTNCSRALIGPRILLRLIDNRTRVLDLGGNDLGNVGHIRRLGALPVGRHIRELHLAHNAIAFLMPFLNDFREIRHLDLSHNSITDIVTTAFDGASTLRILDLSYNRITKVSDGAFATLYQLERLNLSHNNLNNIYQNTLAGGGALVLLDLSWNKLRTLQNSALTGMISLRHLDLSHNLLQNLAANTFAPAHPLHTLRIHDNTFRHVPTKFLRRFRSLRELDFSANSLQVLMPYAFANVSVQELQISNSPSLRMVEANSFSSVKSLVTLRMSANKKLFFLSPAAFGTAPMPALHSLDLSKNALRFIFLDAVTLFPSLKRINLSANPLVCDCSLAWAKELLTKRSLPEVVLENEHGTECVKTKGYTRTLPLLSYQPPLLHGVRNSLGVMQPHCPPRIISENFKNSYELTSGDTLELACRVIGRLPIKQGWTSRLVHQRRGGVQDTKGDNRILTTKLGTLTFRDVQRRDAGSSFTCTATNSIGDVAERSTYILVQDFSGRVKFLSVGAAIITLTWSHGASRRPGSRIAYREGPVSLAKNASISTFNVVKITPFMKTYTADRLEPGTLYTFCITVGSKTQSLTFQRKRMNCRSISTKTREFLKRGIFDARGLVVGLLLSLAALGVAITIVSAYLIRRYNRKQRRADPFADNYSQKLFGSSTNSLCSSTATLARSHCGENGGEHEKPTGGCVSQQDYQSTRCGSVAGSSVQYRRPRLRRQDGGRTTQKDRGESFVHGISRPRLQRQPDAQQFGAKRRNFIPANAGHLLPPSRDPSFTISQVSTGTVGGGSAHRRWPSGSRPPSIHSSAWGSIAGNRHSYCSTNSSAASGYFGRCGYCHNEIDFSPFIWNDEVASAQTLVADNVEEDVREIDDTIPTEPASPDAERNVLLTATATQTSLAEMDKEGDRDPERNEMTPLCAAKA